MKILNKFLLIVFILSLDHNRSVKSANSNVLPTKADLPIYLKALEKIVHSAGTPLNKIDGNFGLGLFLANVNLKSVMLRKNASMPIALKILMQRIITKNNALLSYFKYIRANKFDNYELTYLFLDENTWADKLQEFGKVSDAQLQGFSEEYLTDEYSNWSWYEKRILDFDNNIPNPEQSDACMISLRWNPPKAGTQSYKCATPNECLIFVENGSDFGYALLHRVLFLLIARFSRGCYAFTPQLDAALVDKLCESVYEEAHYIVMNDFQSPDLLMEQISTCALAGHVRFLQRSWLSRLLIHQTPFGCFSAHLSPVNNRVTPLSPSYSAPTCNSHVSGVAAAALSAVARYIIETYF